MKITQDSYGKVVQKKVSDQMIKLIKNLCNVQLPIIESFDFNSYTSIANGFQVEDQLIEEDEVA